MMTDEQKTKEIARASDALLGTLWQLTYSGMRTFEENWAEMDRNFPQARWLHNALKGENHPCPACGGETNQDSVDVGVGVIHGPRGCIECGWSEADEYGYAQA